MGAQASVGNRYDYSESTEIQHDAIQAAMRVIENGKGLDSNGLNGRANANGAKEGILACPFYRRHPFIDYRFDKKIGEGAFSTVYKATQINKSGQIVMHNFSTDPENPDWRALRYAIKEVVLQDLTKQQIRNVEREIQILSQLNHPDIVCMHAVYSTGPNVNGTKTAGEETGLIKDFSTINLFEQAQQYTQLFIVLEYLRGGELLKAVCQRKVYTEDDARALLLQIFEGIRYIHSKGIIHRDIKPENLILSTKSLDNLIKIVDFGFACHADPNQEGANMNRPRSDSLGSDGSKDGKNTTQDFLCGTPGYIAPEVYKSRLYTTKCDMWAAGVVMYILLSGTMPFSVSDNKSLMRGEFSFPHARWATVSKSAQDLVARLLNVNHKARFSAAEALDHPWTRRRVNVSLTQSPTISVSPPCTENLERSSAECIKLENSRSTEGDFTAAPAPTAGGNENSMEGETKTDFLDDPLKNEAKPRLESLHPIGELTHNLPSLRHLTVSQRFHRSLVAVRSAIRFKSLGADRERRRSNSGGDEAVQAELAAEVMKSLANSLVVSSSPNSSVKSPNTGSMLSMLAAERLRGEDEPFDSPLMQKKSVVDPSFCEDESTPPTNEPADASGLLNEESHLQRYQVDDD